MSRFEILHDAGSSLLHSKRLWLIQFVANPLLFALFVGWLLLPVATEFHLLLNGLVIVVVAAAALVLHAGTLNFYSQPNRDENRDAHAAFGRQPGARGGQQRAADQRRVRTAVRTGACFPEQQQQHHLFGNQRSRPL